MNKQEITQYNRDNQALLEQNLMTAKIAMDGVHTNLSDMAIEAFTSYDENRKHRQHLADSIQRLIGLLEQLAVSTSWHEGELPE